MNIQIKELKNSINSEFFERTLIEDSLFVETILTKPNQIKNDTGIINKALSI